jgi:formylglycine-generating enzyme
MQNKLPVFKINNHNRWQLCQRFFFVCILIAIYSKVFTQNGSTFVIIPKGNYFLGKKGHLLNPAKQLKMDSFAISTTEITNQQFSNFVQATQYITIAEKNKNALCYAQGLQEFRWYEDSTANWRYPNGKKNGGIESKMNHPVTTISYTDALAYCKWAGVRLPTLNEWEVASRANSRAYFFWGTTRDSLPRYSNVWYGDNHLTTDSSDGYIFTAPVASFAPNAWGLYDVYGNVFEFCSGVLEKYKNNKSIVHARGGSWWCSKSSCNFFNSVDIGRVARNASFSNQGFRVVQNK